MIVSCYRCVAGSYDDIRNLNIYGCDSHILYTDARNKLPLKWEVKELSHPPRLISGHDKNRFHKCFPHHLLPCSDYSVYMDGNVEFSGEVSSLVNVLQDSGASLGVFRHPDNRNLVEESKACLRLNKFDDYDAGVVTKQLEAYSSDGYDLRAPIGANYLIVRRHDDPDLKLAMSLWWAHTFEYTKRDQMSLMYCLWRYGVKWVFLDDYIKKEDGVIVRTPHGNNSVVDKAKKIVKKLSYVASRMRSHS